MMNCRPIKSSGTMAVLPPDPVFTLKTNNSIGLIHCLCFPPPIGHSSGPNRLLAGTEPGSVYIWNLDNNRLQHHFEVGPSLLSIQHTDDTMITQEKMGAIKIWQRENECQYTQIGTINSGIGFCRNVLAENKYIATAQYNSTVEIYDFKTQTKVSSFEPQKTDLEKLGNIMCLNHFNRNGNDYILSGYESGDLVLWDPKFQSKYLSKLKLKDDLITIDFDTQHMRGIAGNSTNYLQVFSVNTATQEIRSVVDLYMMNPGCNMIKIRHDKKVFVSGGWDGYIRIYSWKSVRPLAVLTEHKGMLSDIAFSGMPVQSWGANLMAAAGSDEKISLWNLYN